jgi:hypothetical protein
LTTYEVSWGDTVFCPGSGVFNLLTRVNAGYLIGHILLVSHVSRDQMIGWYWNAVIVGPAIFPQDDQTTWSCHSMYTIQGVNLTMLQCNVFSSHSAFSGDIDGPS